MRVACPGAMMDSASPSPMGTGDFAVNAGFAAITLGPGDAASGFGSPLTPSERRSVVAVLASRRCSVDGATPTDASTACDEDSPAFSPALAAVVAKAVAGKLLTLLEKGALQGAMESQDRRRRARARRASLENRNPNQQFHVPPAVSPYDPKTPTGADDDSFRFPAMTDDNTPSTKGSSLIGAAGGDVLTPASNCSSVVSLPSDSQIKQNLERNPVRRAMARAARGEQLTPVSAANARAARQIVDGKVVSHEMARALEEASTTVTPNRHVTPGGGGFGSPMPNGDGDFQFGFEFNDAVNDFEFHKKTAERLIPSIKSIDQMFSSIKSIGAAMDTPTMNKIYAKSDSGETLSDRETEILRRYLMTSPPSIPSAVARRHKERVGKNGERPGASPGVGKIRI